MSGGAYPPQLVEAGVHDDPLPEPVPAAGTQTLTWSPAYELTIVQVLPAGHVPVPPAVHDAAQ